jgi:hypothetical protein
MKPNMSALICSWVFTALLAGAAFAAAPGPEEWERVVEAAKKEGKVALI